MLNTKLFQLLQTLNIYELNRFGKFLCSPYFNEDERLLNLFDILSPYFNQQTHNSLEQKKIWKEINTGKKFHQLKFARLFSDLLKKLEEFLVFDDLKQNESRKQKNLLAHLTEKKLAKHYPEAAKLARKKLEATAHRDGEYYLQLFKLKYLTHQWSATNSFR